MGHPHRFDHEQFRVAPGQRVDLSKWPTEASDDIKKKQAKEALEEDVSALAESQELLWADGRFSVLIILQGRDAAGKDSTIKHVMSGVNPQGCEVHSFKAPSAEELAHPFLWRPTRCLPAQGRIGIFNRSYYEEVLVVRVHPHFLEPQKLPPRPGEDLWQMRFDDINRYERTLTRNGVCIIKFCLHLSRKEQKKRFLDRLNRPDKHWKFSAADLRERAFWDDYTHAYEQMLSATSTEWAPWYVVPSDDKWLLRAVVADVITARVDRLDLRWPEVSPSDEADLDAARKQLEAED